MRFVWAVVAFVLAAGLIAMGIAQRTVFLGPDEQTITVESELEAPYTVIDSAVFDALPEALPGESGTLEISGDGEIFATYARTHDMLAWLSDQRFTHTTVGDEGIETATVEPTVELDGEPEGRDPAGSDLWLEEFAGEGTLEERFSFPEGMELSVLVASDGTAPAPSSISLTWPIDNSTPSVPWFIGGGLVMLLIGLVLYILGLHHSRRSRGPRRKGLPVPATAPITIDKTALDAAPERDAVTDGSDGDEAGAGRADDGAQDVSSSDDDTPTDAATRKRVIALRSRRLTLRRARIAIPALGLSVALLAGCTSDGATMSLESSPAPEETEQTEEDAAEPAQRPAITEAQAERIVADLSETVAEADEANDASLAARRLTGTALTMREVNYSLRGDVDDYSSLPAIPSDPIRILLPQAYDGWPRTALVVVEDESDSTVPPTIMMLTQEDPWSNYKATLIASLEASAEIPELAPAWQGTAFVPPESSFLQLAPDQVAGAYADILGEGEDSEYAGLFDEEQDAFRIAVQERREATLREFNETAEETGEMTFGQRAASVDPYALLTLHSGAIVGVVVVEEENVRPTDEDAVIRFEDDEVLQSLTGEEQSAGGVRTRYVDQLFFYVPAQGSTEQIRLLGRSSSIRDAQLLEADD